MLTDGSTFTWEYFQPVKLVQEPLDKCSGIARLYAEKLRDNPPSPDKPWRIVLGCDEHTPGSKEGSDNRREKTWISSSSSHPVIARGQVFKEVAWRMVGGDVEGNHAAIGEVPHALEFWCRSRSTLACA